MNTQQIDEIITRMDRMVEGNDRLLKAVAAMPPELQIENIPLVISSIDNSMNALKSLRNGAKQLRTVAA